MVSEPINFGIDRARGVVRSDARNDRTQHVGAVGRGFAFLATGGVSGARGEEQAQRRGRSQCGQDSHSEGTLSPRRPASQSVATNLTKRSLELLCLSLARKTPLPSS